MAFSRSGYALATSPNEYSDKNMALLVERALHAGASAEVLMKAGITAEQFDMAIGGLAIPDVAKKRELYVGKPIQEHMLSYVQDVRAANQEAESQGGSLMSRITGPGPGVRITDYRAPAEAATIEDDIAAENKQRARRARTLLTGPRGDTSKAPVNRPSLLGLGKVGNPTLG